jgi:hypothetical protein
MPSVHGQFRKRHARDIVEPVKKIFAELLQSRTISFHSCMNDPVQTLLHFEARVQGMRTK